MKLYYFAHPYTGDEANNFILANERTQKLLDLGYNVLSPVTYTHPLHAKKERNYAFWMDFCLVLVEKCDGIIFAPGWQNSKGCMLEADHSEGKEILFYEEVI
jgi:hypothetical protein